MAPGYPYRELDSVRVRKAAFTRTHFVYECAGEHTSFMFEIDGLFECIRILRRSYCFERSVIHPPALDRNAATGSYSVG